MTTNIPGNAKLGAAAEKNEAPTTATKHAPSQPAGSKPGSKPDPNQVLKSLPMPEFEAKLGSSPDGLTQADAQKRLTQYGPNQIEEKKTNELLKFLTYFWGPIPWMIEAAVILSAMARHWPDFGIILLLLLTNAVVGFWEEHEAGNAIAALKATLAIKARVKRDGKWINPEARELVPGDVIRVRLGDVVPADARLLDGDPVEVDQSALTGESLPATRKTGEAIFSGSIVRQGEIGAMVYATGADTYFGKTAELVQGTTTVSHFQRAVLNIGNYLIILAAVLVALIVGVAIYRGDPILSTLQFALVLTVAAIPVAMPTAILIRRARKLYINDDIGLDLANTVYALDSTTIDLCLSLFPWADFRSTKAAIKMHTLLDLRGPIPSFIHVSNGKMGDALALDLIAPEAGALYVMDRGYVDFRRLYVLHQAGAFFVTRTKINMNYHRVYSHAVDKMTGLRFDQTITLDGFYSQRHYPQHLRRVGFVDPETSKRLVFLTNNFTLPASTICALYKARWQVELFFKWIKQNLRIKHFYGTSENAVKTQIWTAVSVYALAAIIKKELALDVSLYTFLQILSVHSFEKIQLSCAFQGGDNANCDDPFDNQMNLFDF